MSEKSKLSEDVKPTLSPAGANPMYPPVALDNTKAAVGVWLVKVSYFFIKLIDELNKSFDLQTKGAKVFS